MKKLFLVFALIAFVALTGCQQAQQSSTSTVTKTLPDASAQVYAQTASGYANAMISSMSGWANTGSISQFGVKGSSAGSKTITGPDANGYYHIVETLTGTGFAYDFDIYGKLIPATGNPTEVDIYGTVTVTVGTTSYVMAYGSSSSPFKGTITWNAAGTDVASVALNGAIVSTITTPKAGGTGNDTIEMTISTTNLSVAVTAGADYPSGSVTIAIKYNGAAQPDMTVTFNGTSTATWAYGGTSGSFTVSAASVN